MAVFRLTRKAGEKAGKYAVQFRDVAGIVRRAPGFTSQAASKELERSLLKLVALRTAGAGPDAELTRQMESWPGSLRDKLAGWGLIDRERAAAGKGLQEHIANWRLSLEAKGDCPRHIKGFVACLEHVISDCGWNRLSDIAAGGIERWKLDARAKGKSASTINHHVRAAKTFCGWLVKERLVTENPIRHVDMLNAETDRCRERRALTPEEIGRLLAAAEKGEEHHGLPGHERALLYRVALSTGLRYNELYTLTRSNSTLRAKPLPSPSSRGMPRTAIRQPCPCFPTLPPI